MKLTADEFVKQFLPDFEKAIFENEQWKSLVQDHKKLVDIFPNKRTDDIKFSQTAKYFRALTRGDMQTFKKIKEEENNKYIQLYGGGDFGKKVLTDLMTEGDTDYGGSLVPVEYYLEVFRIAVAYGIARRDCMILPMTRASMLIPTITTLPTTHWGGENVAMTESRAGTGQETLATENHTALLPFSYELLMDATPPLIQLLTELTGEAFMAGEDDALWNGKGTSVGDILGNANVHVVPMEAGLQSFEDITADHLLELEDAVDDGAEEGAKYYFNRNIMKFLRKLKTTTKDYILQRPTAGEPPTLWDYPYEKSPKLPGSKKDLPDTPFVVFGNLKRCVVFGDRMAMTIDLLKEATIGGVNLAVNNLVALRFVERLDITVVLPGGIAILKTSKT